MNPQTGIPVSEIASVLLRVIPPVAAAIVAEPIILGVVVGGGLVLLCTYLLQPARSGAQA